MAEGPSQRTSRGESGEIATSTLAEIYAQQGLLGRALAIYRRILARAPEDAEIAERIDRLERRIAESGIGPEASVGAAGAAVEGTSAPPPRERLPWDPPAVVTEPELPEPVLPEPESPEPVLPEPELPEPVLPEPESRGTTEAEAAEEDSTAPTRVGRMDSGAFAAWLEGR